MTHDTATGRAKRHAREVELLALVDDLTERFVHDAEVLRDRCGDWSRASWVVRHIPWRTREAALLEQLRVLVAGRRAAVRKAAAGGVVDATRLLDPAPCNGLPEAVVCAAVDALADIHTGARRLRQAMGARGRRGAAGELRAVAGLAADVDDELLDVALRRVRSWHRTALVVLGYEVPVATLRDLYCPQCGGPLRVLTDASSDVWCSGPPVCDLRTRRETTARSVCSARWPRAHWAGMLEAEPRLLDTADLAVHLGTTPGHVRLLVSKGVLPAPVDSRPTGGQATHLHDVLDAIDAWTRYRSQRVAS